MVYVSEGDTNSFTTNRDAVRHSSDADLMITNLLTLGLYPQSDPGCMADRSRRGRATVLMIARGSTGGGGITAWADVPV